MPPGTLFTELGCPVTVLGGRKRSLLNSIQNPWSKACGREHSKQRGKEVVRCAVTEGSTLKP